MKKVKSNIVSAVGVVNLNVINTRKQRDHEKWIFAEKLGKF